MAPAKKFRQFATLSAVLACAMCLPFWVAQVMFALDASIYDADMETMFFFYRFYDPALFKDDYVADYYLSQWMPVGYYVLHRAAATFAEPLHTLIAIRLLMWLAPLPFVWQAGYRLGGRANAVVSVLLYSTSVVFLRRSSGGMAHSFGLPLVWWGIAAMLSGRPRQLAAATVISAAMYPVVTPLLGIALALLLLFPQLTPAVPRSAKQFSVSFLQKCLWLAVPALASFALLAATLYIGSEQNGTVMDAATLKSDYPESSYRWSIIDPAYMLVLMYRYQYFYPFGWEGSVPVIYGFLIMLLIGALLLDRRDLRPRGLRPYVLSLVFSLCISRSFLYDHAYRFVSYGIPPLVTLYTPLVFRRLVQLVLPYKAQAVAFMALVLIYVGSHSKPDAELAGYYMRFESRQEKAIAFIKTLPADAMVAGWPDEAWGGIVHAVPLLAQRKALVTLRTHALIHHDYIMEMRERMFALIDAYLAMDLAPLLRLRDEQGVDYLVVNESDLGVGCYAQPLQRRYATNAPAYFEPFDSYARERWKAVDGKPFAVLTLAGDALVYAQDGVRVIDLAKLPAAETRYDK